MQVSGPARRRDLGGRYALAQRVDLQAAPQLVRLKVRSLRDAELLLRVCERHLLYARRCASATARLAAGGRWQRLALPLVAASGAGGGLPSRGARYAPRSGLFTLAVLTPGATVELAEVGLLGTSGGELLANGGFSAGLAHWFPAAQSHFLPWHVDNLYLEVLIERGLPALLAFVALLALAVRNLLRARCALAACIAASLAGAAAIGLLDSLLDMPRIAFLLLLLMLSAAGAAQPGRGGGRRDPPGSAVTRAGRVRSSMTTDPPLSPGPGTASAALPRRRRAAPAAAGRLPSSSPAEADRRPMQRCPIPAAANSRGACGGILCA